MNAGCRLRVRSGVHAGAEITLADGSYLVGANLACDLVLLDPGVAGTHLRLHVRGTQVSAERIDDAPVEQDGRLVEQDEFEVADGAVLSIGSACISLDGLGAAASPDSREDALQDPDADEDGPPLLEIVDGEEPATSPTRQDSAAGTAVPPPAPPRRKRRHPVVWGLPLMVLAVGLSAFFGSRALQASAPLRAPEARLADPAAQPRDEVVARVREFLGDDMLDVQRDPEGRIVVSGKTRAAVVQEQLKNLRNEFKGTIEIVDRVSYVSDNKPQNTMRLPQRITDVHIGNIRWFQTADGMKNFEGSVLEDGAEVVRISIDSIVFRRNGKLAVFQLGSGSERDE